jgi:hypothetical protein
LFLDDLKKEFKDIQAVSVRRTKEKRLDEFQDKLASLTFLDPACGSGNFLTETYLSLRRLENEVIRERVNGQMTLGEVRNPIKVSIHQFYGIEINDFAVTVAKTALWIAESQMLEETKSIVYGFNDDFLPLKTYVNITEGNALRIDWSDVIAAGDLNYIMGNPPFVGKKYQSKNQKNDMLSLFGKKFKGVGNLDYVTAWYKKSCDYMINNKEIKTAFVSTNSIVQGEQIPIFWKQIYDAYPMSIRFAYQTFKWNSEASEKAAVHCVIIGFALKDSPGAKYIYSSERKEVKTTIHPYLQEMPLVFIENRNKPICKVNSLVYGSFALDDGNYTISEAEYEALIKEEPALTKYLKLFIGSEEFINNKKRYCMWLKDVDLREIRKLPIVMKKIQNVKSWRSSSSRLGTLKAAETPYLFAEIRQPESDYLAIPITSSERRRYIPMGYMSKEIIASNHLLVLPNASLYEFGIMMSNVHMAWMRTVAGRMKSDYNYSAKIVYNNFPWPEPTEQQKRRIGETAQGILDARSIFSDSSLADLYDPLMMPPELRRAHIANDKAVMAAYGFLTKITESDCVAELMKMYQALTSENK